MLTVTVWAYAGTKAVRTSDGSELLSVENVGHNFQDWDLSPNGKNIALVDDAGGAKILILSTEGKARRIVSLSAWPLVQFVSWSADGKKLYVQSGQYLGRDMGKIGLS